jgi:serine/threonine protein phosphatase 1
MPGRIIAIGDIHGCLTALNTLLRQVDPQGKDTIVALGDYVDRGPDSRGTIDRLIELKKQCNLVALLGNHDYILLMIAKGSKDLMDDWLRFGGDATVASYGNKSPVVLPAEHLAFFHECRLYYETERHFFVHGNYAQELPLAEQDPELMLWDSLKRRVPGPHCSGKTAIVGHSSQKSGEVLDLGYVKCIDTCCYGGGWLTALDVRSGRLWQANQRGALRNA